MDMPCGLVLVVALALVFASGCDSKSKSGGAPNASSPAASSSDDDQLPAIEVKPPTAPKYSLAKLNQAELTALLSKYGWTTTLAGKTPGGGGESAIRVGGFKKDAEGMLECTVSVRCGPAAAPASAHPVGEAYYAEAPCEMTVEVRRGIRKKSVESKRLLEQLLASQPG